MATLSLLTAFRNGLQLHSAELRCQHLRGEVGDGCRHIQLGTAGSQ